MLRIPSFNSVTHFPAKIARGFEIAKMASHSEELGQQAAEQLNVEIVPGTEVMKDVGQVKFAHAGGASHGSV